MLRSSLDGGRPETDGTRAAREAGGPQDTIGIAKHAMHHPRTIAARPPVHPSTP